MPKTSPTEVLVSGAGPVGMLTALFLAQGGIRTRIVDQNSDTAGRSYSCALHPYSIQLLHEAGVGAEAVKLGRRINTVGFYDGSERRAEIKFSELPVEFPFALVLEQSRLEALLERGLRRAGVRIDWNHRLADFEMDDKGGTATIEKLGMTGKGYGVPDFEMGVEKSFPERTEFIIGADGANSLLRKQLAIRCERTGAPQHYAVYEIETGGDCGHEARVVLDETTSVLWPLSDSRCRWSFQIGPMGPDEDFPEKERDRVTVVERPSEYDSVHQLKQLASGHAPWFQNPVKEVVWVGDVQFVPRFARLFGRNACWLVGDAAHQTGPVGMQSMNIGLREAADLAEIMTKILRLGGSIDLLRDYNRHYRSEWQQLLGFTSREMSMDKATSWVRQRAFRIAGSIPASGDDLASLLKQLGLEFQTQIPAVEAALI